MTPARGRGFRAAIVVCLLALSITGAVAPVAVRPASAQQSPPSEKPSSGESPPPSDSATASSTLQEFLRGTSGGISANPGATNVLTGTGMLGRLLGFGPDSGVRLGGMWIGAADYLFAGGNDPRTWSFNSLVLVDLNLDLEKILRIPGAEFGVEFLQFNGSSKNGLNTNGLAGSVTGYNGLPGPPPLNRSELYELWWRQRLFDDKLIIRIGKTVPSFDFGNVVRPVTTQDETLAIPAVSSLIYKPLFVSTSMLGIMPGYYDSAYGVTITVAPTTNFYVSLGAFDGNVARGIETGLRAGPEFNGYYFAIGEVGYAWRLGPDGLPGTVAVGGWGQTGELTAKSGDGSTFTQNGVKGIYTFVSQRLWLRSPGVDNSGLSGYFQFAISDAETIPGRTSLGAGLTGFGLIPGRPRDSIGAGVSATWLNQRLGLRNTEVLLAAYYQAHMIADIYLQPTLTFIPNPGASPKLSPATAITLQATFLF